MALSPRGDTARRMQMAWGLHAVVCEDAEALSDLVQIAARVAGEEGFVNPGQKIILTAGVPLRTPGATNLLRIATIADDGRTGI